MRGMNFRIGWDLIISDLCEFCFESMVKIEMDCVYLDDFCVNRI